MERRRTELSEIHNFVEGVEKEVSSLLQSLGWNKERLLEDAPKATCSYNRTHKIPTDKMNSHERQCFLKSHQYIKNDQFLPDPFDINANTLIKFDKQAIVTVLNNASCGDPLFKQGNRSQSPEPWTLARLQSSYTADERRAIHDAVVQAVPSCHDLADLALPSISDGDQVPQNKSRAEILAELRDMKRRRAKYRVAPKTRKYSDVLRDVIKTQMEFYTEAEQKAACPTVAEEPFEQRDRRDPYHSNPRERMANSSAHEGTRNMYERCDHPSSSYYERQHKNRAREMESEEREDRRVGRARSKRDCGTNVYHQTVGFGKRRSRERSSLEKDTHFSKSMYRQIDLSYKYRKERCRENEKSSNGDRDEENDFVHASSSRNKYKDNSSVSEHSDSQSRVWKKSKKLRHREKELETRERTKFRFERKSNNTEYKSRRDRSCSTENVRASSRKKRKDEKSRHSHVKSSYRNGSEESSFTLKIERDDTSWEYANRNDSHKEKSHTRRRCRERHDHRNKPYNDARRLGETHKKIKLERDVSTERLDHRQAENRYENNYASSLMTNNDRNFDIRVKEEILDPEETIVNSMESLNSSSLFTRDICESRSRERNKFGSTSQYDERGQNTSGKYDVRYYERNYKS